MRFPKVPPSLLFLGDGTEWQEGQVHAQLDEPENLTALLCLPGQGLCVRGGGACSSVLTPCGAALVNLGTVSLSSVRSSFQL